jgi:hypothetical protein
MSRNHFKPFPAITMTEPTNQVLLALPQSDQIPDLNCINLHMLRYGTNIQNIYFTFRSTSYISKFWDSHSSDYKEYMGCDAMQSGRGSPLNLVVYQTTWCNMPEGSSTLNLLQFLETQCYSIFTTKTGISCTTGLEVIRLKHSMNYFCIITNFI